MMSLSWWADRGISYITTPQSVCRTRDILAQKLQAPATSRGRELQQTGNVDRERRCQSSRAAQNLTCAPKIMFELFLNKRPQMKT